LGNEVTISAERRLTKETEMRLAIKRDSWHGRIARFGGLIGYMDQTDLCAYFWAFVRGCIGGLLFALFGLAALVAMVAMPLAYVVAWVVVGIQPPPLGIEIAGAAFWSVGLVIVAKIYIDDHKPSIGANVPGARLLAAGYRGWKDKTCVLIELK
jgi:hypothetical protein